MLINRSQQYTLLAPETLLFVLIHSLGVIGSNAFFLTFFRMKVHTIRTPEKAIPLQGFGLSKKVFLV